VNNVSEVRRYTETRAGATKRRNGVPADYDLRSSTVSLPDRESVE
jgi:hypothetical protein